MNIKQAFGMLAGVLILIGVSQVQAAPFVRPPEIYAPVWETPFPYQRDIDMQFTVYPVAPPGSGIPGADYQGTLDQSLLDSDYVTFIGAMGWYQQLPGISPTGLIGIDNREGTETVTGSAFFHIDNTIDPNEFKHFYIEYSWVYAHPASDTLALSGPPGYSHDYLGDVGAVLLPNGLYVNDHEFQITPNPPYETIGIYITVGAGAYIFFDDVHIATECVPEPATLTLLGISIISLLAYEWRRRK